MKFLSILLLFGALILISCGGDSGEDMDIDCSQTDLKLTVSSQSLATCTEGGSVEIISIGGSGAIKFSIDGSSFQSTGVFNNLAAGSHTVTAEDQNGCKANVNLTIGSDGNSPTIEVTHTISGCESNNGSITIAASDGTEPYEFSLNNGAFQSSNKFTNLEAGSYEVVVKDAEGCETPEIMHQVLTGISLEDDVMPIIEEQCTFSGCHNGSSNAPNFLIKSNVVSRATSIKLNINNGNMPRTPGSLTQDEKDKILCWVDDGGIDN